ncbi:MAG: CCA tRNA nucleotidyltransferase [Chlamydiota bacterium]
MPARPYATDVVRKLKEAGFIAYFAGGWVRDYLMKRPSDDIDIATSASVEEIQALFPKTIPVGVAFGIIIVVHDKFQFEVATFRQDRGYVDGRRPSGIDPATPEEDAKRRDFTINGMFYDPIEEKLLDFVEGQKDIEKKLIKAIGNPHDRFAEDRLRMMRAVRYSTRFDFTIEQATFDAILAHAKDLVPAVAIERIWQEFKKMSQFAHFDEGLITLHELKLLPTIFPSLETLSLEELKKRVSTIEQFPKNTPPIAELLELFPESSLENLLELSEYLKLSRGEKEFVRFLHHTRSLFAMPNAWLEKLELIEWAQFYAHPSSEICLEIFAAHYPPEEKTHFLSSHATRRQTLEKAIKRIQENNPVIKAEDLMKRGIAPGKKMGDLLRAAERIAVNQNLEDKDAILKQLTLALNRLGSQFHTS